MTDRLTQFRQETHYLDSKNLRVLLGLGTVTKDSTPADAHAAWLQLLTDPVIREREFNAPGEKESRDVTHCGHPTHYVIRENIVRKIVSEMSEADRAALRERLLARRVKAIPSATQARADTIFI